MTTKIKMNKKTIINLFYGLAISLMAYGIYDQVSGESRDINIFFWLGLMAYSIGALMKQSDKKKPEN